MRRGSSLVVVVGVAIALIASSSVLPTASALSKITPAAPGAPVANNTVTRIQNWLEDQVSVSLQAQELNGGMVVGGGAGEELFTKKKNNKKYVGRSEIESYAKSG